MSTLILPINIQTNIKENTMAGIHPGKRKANPELTKNGKPRIKGWSLAKLKDTLEKQVTRKTAARYRNEILRRFPTAEFTNPSFDK